MLEAHRSLGEGTDIFKPRYDALLHRADSYARLVEAFDEAAYWLRDEFLPAMIELIQGLGS